MVWRHRTRFPGVTDGPKVGLTVDGTMIIKMKAPHSKIRDISLEAVTFDGDGFFSSYVRCVIRFEHLVIFSPPSRHTGLARVATFVSVSATTTGS